MTAAKRNRIFCVFQWHQEVLIPYINEAMSKLSDDIFLSTVTDFRKELFQSSAWFQVVHFSQGNREIYKNQYKKRSKLRNSELTSGPSRHSGNTLCS